MPGRSGSEPAWGELPLVVDTSAWARAGNQAVRDRWLTALLGGRLRLSPLVRMEILLSARGGAELDLLAERLGTIRGAPLRGSTIRAAEAGMRASPIAPPARSASRSSTISSPPLRRSWAPRSSTTTAITTRSPS